MKQYWIKLSEDDVNAIIYALDAVVGAVDDDSTEHDKALLERFKNVLRETPKHTAYSEPPRQLDGRTLYVLMRWTQTVLDNVGHEYMFQVTEEEGKEIQSALANAKWVLEVVKFNIPQE